MKVLLGMSAEGASGHQQYFAKPLLLTWLMFVAMMLALPVHWARMWMKKRTNTSAVRPIGVGDNPLVERSTDWRTLVIFSRSNVF